MKVSEKWRHNNILPYIDSQLFNGIRNVLWTCSKVLPCWWVLRHDNKIFSGINYTTGTVDKPSTCFDNGLLSLTCLYGNLCGYCDKLTRAGINTQIVDSIWKRFSFKYSFRIICWIILPNNGLVASAHLLLFSSE